MKYINKIFLLCAIGLFAGYVTAAEIKVDYNGSGDDTTVVNHAQVLVSKQDDGEDPQIKTDCESEGNICLTAYVYSDRIEIEAQNTSKTLRTLTVEYILNNMVAQNDTSGKNIVLKPGQKEKLETLVVDNPDYNYGYNYSYNSVFGVVDAVHDDAYEYDLPFEGGNKYMLWQGIGGKFSHADEENYYAYDFKMPMNTPILAAREGVIAKVVDSFKEGGIDASLKNKANYVYIQHGDGTIGVYAHIQYKGSMVQVGDAVQKGQKIALSGNTGYTTNPHLHFSVFKVIRAGKYKSVPIKVKTSTGVQQKLKAGEFYEK